MTAKMPADQFDRSMGGKRGGRRGERPVSVGTDLAQAMWTLLSPEDRMHVGVFVCACVCVSVRVKSVKRARVM